MIFLTPTHAHSTCTSTIHRTSRYNDYEAVLEVSVAVCEVYLMQSLHFCTTRIIGTLTLSLASLPILPPFRATPTLLLLYMFMTICGMLFYLFCTKFLLFFCFAHLVCPRHIIVIHIFKYISCCKITNSTKEYPVICVIIY
jgi:hypothetical protein